MFLAWCALLQDGLALELACINPDDQGMSLST
jgi:hypothetical protein